MIKFLLILLISLVPYLLSKFILFKPIKFRNFCHKYNIDFIMIQFVISVICRFITMLLFLSTYLFYLRINFYGILLFVLGGSLLTYAWNLIGNNGMFHGKEMGLSNQVDKDLILKLIKQPQYVGVIMICQGISLLFPFYEPQFILQCIILCYVNLIISEN